MKHLDKKSVQGIVANVAHGKSIETTATLFNVSPLTVGNVVRGVVHADKSGLSGDDVGTKYIRANKDKFPLTVKKVKAVKKTETTTETQPVAPVAETPAVAPIATTTRSAKKSSTPVTISDRAGNIVSEAVKMVDDFDSEMYRMETEIETKMRECEAMRSAHATIKSHRDHWKSIVEQMKPSESADAVEA
jgi:hypothetical protein